MRRGRIARASPTACVRGTIERVAEIDALLAAHAQNWRVERMAVLDRLVLRLAVYELLTEPDTPAQVIINEALELARAYSGEEAVGFVNGSSTRSARPRARIARAPDSCEAVTRPR